MSAGHQSSLTTGGVVTTSFRPTAVTQSLKAQKCPHDASWDSLSTHEPALCLLIPGVQCTGTRTPGTEALPGPGWG